MGSDRQIPNAFAELDPAAVLENAHDAFVAMDSTGTLVGWNKAATRMFGWQLPEVVGRRLSDVVIPEGFRKLHEDGLRLFLETGVGPVLGTTIEVEALHRDGHLFPVELSITPYETGDGDFVFGAFLSDVTDRRRLQRWQRASERVAWTIAAGEPGDAVVSSLLPAIGEEMEFSVGLWWPREGDQLRLGHSWVSAPAYDSFVSDNDRTFARAEGLPGLAWDTATSIWSRELGDDPRYLRADATRAAGLHSGVFIPAVAETGLVGVFEFLTSDPSPVDDDLVHLLTSFGRQVGALMAREQNA